MDTNKPVVMVVDDQRDFIEGVKLILEEEGYEVWSAENGQDALEVLHDSFQNRHSNGDDKKYLPDLILADIMMPVMDGYAFHDKVRGNPYLNHIPFVFLTAKTDSPDIRVGKELGADDYLTKPCQPDDLLASVRGKLKVLTQRKEIRRQFVGNPSSPSAAGIFVIVALVIAIVIMAVVLTMMFVG